MNDNKLYIGIQAASDLTGLSVQTLRRGAESGRFAVIRAGGGDKGKLLFDRKKLLKRLRDESFGIVKNEKQRSYLASLFDDDDDKSDSKPSSATFTP